MNTERKIPWGLIVGLVLLHASLIALGIGIVTIVGHTAYVKPDSVAACPCDCGPDCQCVDCDCPLCPHRPKPLLKPKGKFEDSREYDPALPPVNEQARNEIKQGKWVYNPNTGEHVWCPTCPNDQPNFLPNTVDRRPLRPTPIVPLQPTPQPARPVPQPAPQPAPSTEPIVLTPADKPVNQPQRFQISLFLLPGDPLSDRLESWFDSNATLVSWRNSCTFQKYTPDNKLYQTMSNNGLALKNAVPVSMFPAVVFADPNGGHIHAAGKGFLPSSPEELIADVHKGREYWGQVKADSGRVQVSQYNWDDAISPKLKLDPQDCPDGICPVPNQDSDKWTPGKKINDIFKKQKEGVVKDLAWGWLEILITGVVTLCALLLGGFALFVIALVAFFGIRAWRNKQ